MRASASVPRRSIDAQTPVLADPELVQPITTDPSSAISTTTLRDRDPRLKPPNGSVVENAPSREDPEDSLSGVGRNIGVRMFPGQWAGLCTTACTLSAPGRDGGTGRRAGLKIPWASARAGSTPAPGTKNYLHDEPMPIRRGTAFSACCHSCCQSSGARLAALRGPTHQEQYVEPLRKGWRLWPVRRGARRATGARRRDVGSLRRRRWVSGWAGRR